MLTQNSRPYCFPLVFPSILRSDLQNRPREVVSPLPTRRWTDLETSHFYLGLTSVSKMLKKVSLTHISLLNNNLAFIHGQKRMSLWDPVSYAGNLSEVPASALRIWYKDFNPGCGHRSGLWTSSRPSALGDNSLRPSSVGKRTFVEFQISRREVPIYHWSERKKNIWVVYLREKRRNSLT